MRSVSASVVVVVSLAGIGLSQCKSPSATIPPSSSGTNSSPVAGVSKPEPVTTTPAGGSASANVATSSSAATVEPKPPPRIEVSGSAAIVLVEDEKAVGGFKSIWIEPGPSVKGSRAAVVVPGQNELYLLVQKPVRWAACACETCQTDPDFRCGRTVAGKSNDYVLKSLKTGRMSEPWKGKFALSTKDNCYSPETEGTFYAKGGVGAFLFAHATFTYVPCLAAHPAFSDEAILLNIETQTIAKLTPPGPSVLAVLKDKAKKEIITNGCVMDENEEPALFDIGAEYDDKGILRGIYSFTMSAPYACGTGPGHYSVLSEQKSDWLPKELESYGKVPEWVAQYLASSKAKYVYMISDGRKAEAAVEFAKK